MKIQGIKLPIIQNKKYMEIHRQNPCFANYPSEYLYNHKYPYRKPKIRSIYENYDAANKIFRKNISKGKGIFGSSDNLEEIMANDIVRRNVVRFFAEYSDEKIDEIDSKKILNFEDIENRPALKEVSNKIPPVSILLYGTNANSNEKIANIISNMTKSKIIEIDNPDTIEDLQNILEKIKTESKNNRQSLLIYVENYDELCFNKDVSNAFNQFLTDCKRENIIVVYSTLYPNEIDSETMKNSFKVPVDAPDRNNYSEVLNKYFIDLSAQERMNIFNTLSEKEGYYTIEQIELMCEIVSNEPSKNPIDNMLQLINRVKPLLSEKDIATFKKNRQNLGVGYAN